MSGHSAAQIRAQLQHPVIDIDGHTVEFVPALEGYLRDEGVRLQDALSLTMPGSLGPVMDWYSLSIAERANQRVARGPWGIGLEHTIDQATAFLPRTNDRCKRTCTARIRLIPAIAPARDVARPSARVTRSMRQWRRPASN